MCLRVNIIKSKLTMIMSCDKDRLSVSTAHMCLLRVHHSVNAANCAASHVGLPNLRTALLVGGLPLANQLYRLKQQVQVRTPGGGVPGAG